jgi:hypothetical protein
MTLWIKSTAGPVRQPQYVIEVVTDPAELAENLEVRDHFDRNSDWLQAHWLELLPEALGKHLAVAGQEAFLADSAAEAIAKARSAHPEDKGVLVRYVISRKGPRIYGIRR